MSLLLPEYLDHLRAELDEEDDIPAEEMTADLRRFFNKLFSAALKSNRELPLPPPTKVPPGPNKVVVLRERYERGEQLFNAEDLRWEHLKVRRKVTRRSRDNGNPLAEKLILDREAASEWRADQAARRAAREGER